MTDVAAANEEAARNLRKQRRSSLVALTADTQNLLECIQWTVQVNEDCAILRDLLTQLGSSRDNAQVRQEIRQTVRRCLDVANSAKDRFLHIVINCRDNVKLQTKAGHQLGTFGFCLTYMQGELRKGLQLINLFPLKGDETLTGHTMQKDIDEIDDILHTVEKHVHYISHSSEQDFSTSDFHRSKSYRLRPTKSISSAPGGSLKESRSAMPLPHANALCTGFMCMPKK